MLLELAKQIGISYQNIGLGFSVPSYGENPNQCFGQPNIYLKIKTFISVISSDTAVINWLHVFLLSY